MILDYYYYYYDPVIICSVQLPIMRQFCNHIRQFMILYSQVKGDIFTKRKIIKLPITCYWIDKSKE